MHEITDSIAAAFDRVHDFEAVQAGRSFEQKVDAVKLLQSAVGIEDETRRLVAERVERIRAGSDVGQVMLGVIVGLLAAQLEAEARQPNIA